MSIGKSPSLQQILSNQVPTDNEHVKVFANYGTSPNDGPRILKTAVVGNEAEENGAAPPAVLPQSRSLESIGKSDSRNSLKGITRSESKGSLKDSPKVGKLEILCKSESKGNIKETTKKSGNALESLTQAFYDTFKLKSRSSDAIDKSTPSPIPPKHLISWLHQTDHTNSVAKLSASSSFTPLETPIIIDLRPTELYSQSHITDAFHVFVTPLLQKRWLRKSSIQPTADGTADAKINIETLIQPENRREEYKKLITEKNYVVVYDENMMENNLPGSVIWTIMNHLSKAGKVVHWIQGGFDAFAQENEFLFVNDQQTSSHEPATPLTPLTPIARTPSFSIQTSGLRTSLSKGKKFSLMCGNFASSSSSSSNLGTIEEPPKSALPGTPRLNNFDQKRLSSILASPSSSSPLTPTTPPNLDPSQILDFLYLGPDIYGNQINWADVMQKLKVTHILNVAMECEPHSLAEVENKFVYKKWNVSDTPDEHIDEFLQETTAYIESARKSNGTVYIHCKAGKSRSATVVLAYLILYQNYTLKQAYEFVKQRRPAVSPNIGFITVLQEIECKRYGLKQSTFATGNL